MNFHFQFTIVYIDQFNLLLSTALDEWQLFSCTTLTDYSLLKEMALFCVREMECFLCTVQYKYQPSNI